MIVVDLSVRERDGEARVVPQVRAPGDGSQAVAAKRWQMCRATPAYFASRLDLRRRGLAARVYVREDLAWWWERVPMHDDQTALHAFEAD
jgi:hypothetical protein